MTTTSGLCCCCSRWLAKGQLELKLNLGPIRTWKLSFSLFMFQELLFDSFRLAKERKIIIIKKTWINANLRNYLKEKHFTRTEPNWADLNRPIVSSRFLPRWLPVGRLEASGKRWILPSSCSRCGKEKFEPFLLHCCGGSPMFEWKQCRVLKDRETLAIVASLG